MRRILLPLAATAVLLAGCTQNVRNDSLIATLNAYSGAVRWDGFQSGLQYVDPAVLKAHPVSDFDLQRYAQLRVSDYDDGNGPVALNDHEVQQTVRISFIDNHTQVERSIIVHQLWRYDAKARHWWLESEPPNPDQN